MEHNMPNMYIEARAKGDEVNAIVVSQDGCSDLMRRPFEWKEPEHSLWLKK